jgi:hypothetical protein
MNREPIQFLPVGKFWNEQPKPMSTANALLIGFTVGFALASVLVMFVASACTH